MRSCPLQYYYSSCFGSFGRLSAFACMLNVWAGLSCTVGLFYMCMQTLIKADPQQLLLLSRTVPAADREDCEPQTPPPGPRGQFMQGRRCHKPVSFRTKIAT